MRTRGLQPRLLYPARLSIKIEGQIKSFPDKRSLKEYTSAKPALLEMLKGLLYEKEEECEGEEYRYEGSKMAMNKFLSRLPVKMEA